MQKPHRTSAILFLLLLFSNVVAQEVGPLLTTKWGQTEPFRQSCPSDKNGNRTPPGCGAVAVGQIVNYYRAWNHGFGHTAYDYTQNGQVAGTVDVDFSQCRFDWDNMLDIYLDNQYTQEQSKAVSDFLFWIGAAMRMQYRMGGSVPANHGCTMWGIHHFLHFSNKGVIRSRRDYTTAEWIEMLNSNLQARHPVYYSARWRNGAQDSEHIFVIDGVDAAKRYCVNFGVGNGVTNREGLDINVLPQWGDGTLGGRGVCWNIGANMMTDIYPADGDEYIDDGLIIVRPLILNDDGDLREATLSLGEAFSLGFRFQHYNIETSTVEYRLCLTDTQGHVINYLKATDGRAVRLGPGYYIDLVKHFRLPADLADGQYEMHFVSRPDDGSEAPWQPVYEALNAGISIQVQDGQARLTVPVNHRRSPNLFLRENIRVVENVYEKQQPGTALLLSMSNPSVSAFCDTLRLYITLDGSTEPFLYETEAAVYDGCEADYHILIPDTTLYLKDKQFSVTCEYKDQARDEFLPLTLKDETTDTRLVAGNSHAGSHLSIYDIHGRRCALLPSRDVESCYPALLHTLPNGIYIVNQYGQSRKIVIDKY